jgi:hypothetical protein
MNTLQMLALVPLFSVLTACVSMSNPNTGDSYALGVNLIKTDARGDKKILSTNVDDQWIDSAGKETEMARLPVWKVSKHNTGIKAWRYGFDSAENYLYIDPQSPIASSNVISDTGWITYLVAGIGNYDFVVKRANFRQHAAPEVLGRLVSMRGEWQFTPLNGQTYVGYNYHLTSKGLLLLRTGSVFTYFQDASSKAEPKVHMLPEGWFVTVGQKGDIEASRLLTVQRWAGGTGFTSAGDFVIGFYDLDSGKFIATMNMHLQPKHEADAFNSKFFLYNTVKGPISIAIEDGEKHVVVRNVRTGQTRVAFERDAGVTFLKTEQKNTGRISLSCAVGFADEAIFDAEDFLYNGRRVPAQ